jgi:hypothetical protein
MYLYMRIVHERVKRGEESADTYRDRSPDPLRAMVLHVVVVERRG